MSVELPKDAEGREIPLDTTAMYGADGKVVNISRWVYCTALDPVWLRARARALRRSRRNVETLKREGRCR